jgi:hypothetical protein
MVAAALSLTGCPEKPAGPADGAVPADVVTTSPAPAPAGAEVPGVDPRPTLIDTARPQEIPGVDPEQEPTPEPSSASPDFSVDPEIPGVTSQPSPIPAAESTSAGPEIPGVEPRVTPPATTPGSDSSGG